MWQSFISNSPNNIPPHTWVDTKCSQTERHVSDRVCHEQKEVEEFSISKSSSKIFWKNKGKFCEKKNREGKEKKRGRENMKNTLWENKQETPKGWWRAVTHKSKTNGAWYRWERWVGREGWHYILSLYSSFILSGKEVGLRPRTSNTVLPKPNFGGGDQSLIFK